MFPGVELRRKKGLVGNLHNAPVGVKSRHAFQFQKQANQGGNRGIVGPKFLGENPPKPSKRHFWTFWAAFQLAVCATLANPHFGPCSLAKLNSFDPQYIQSFGSPQKARVGQLLGKWRPCKWPRVARVMLSMLSPKETEFPHQVDGPSVSVLRPEGPRLRLTDPLRGGCPWAKAKIPKIG